MKHFILLMLFLPLASSLHARQIIDLSTGLVTNDSVLQVPEKNVEYVGDGIVVTYKIQKAALSEDDLYPGTFNLEIPGFSNCMELRMPGIPMGGDYYIVPKDSEPTVALVSAKYKDLKYELAPARWPMSMSDTVSYSKSNVPVIQPYSGFWPQVVVEELPAGMYRRQPIANAAINPVQYNYDNKTVRVYTEIKYKISFANSKSMADLEFEPGSLLNPNYNLATKALVKTGPRSVAAEPMREPGTNVNANAGYLIISVPEFQSTLQEFVKWKKRLGYNVTELYDAAWTPEKIKTAVEQQYDNDSTLYYMLIVGDHLKVPGYSKSFVMADVQDSCIITDMPYACVDTITYDAYPDIYRGRWPATNTNEVQAIVDKTMWYEMDPPVETDFYKKAVHFSFFEDDLTSKHDGVEDGMFVYASENIRNYLINNHGYNVNRVYSINTENQQYWPAKWSPFYSDGSNLPSDLLYENGFRWDGNKWDLVNKINDGVSYVFTCCHGWYDGWSCGNFDTFKETQILQLRNYNQLPIIFSISCLTGNFKHPDCLMKSFLTKENGGAVGAFASSNVSFHNIESQLSSLFFNAIWPNPGFSITGYNCEINNYIDQTKIKETGSIQQMGAILDFAINGLCTNDICSWLDPYTRWNYHLFGDPSMYFRTEQPETLDDFVTVTRISDGVNVHLSDNKSAYIAFYDPISGKSVRKYGTEASYFNEINGAKYVDVVVYTTNCIPYMDLGETYYGTIEPQPSTATRLIGYRDTHNGGVEIDYYMSSSSASQGVTVQIVNLITGNVESSWPLSSNGGVVDQKATISMQCTSGVKVAYMVVGGVPMGNGMKMFVSR